MNLSALGLVFVGGGIGSVLRYLVGMSAGRWLGINFPYGTLAVNLLGGLGMGLVVSVLALRMNAQSENVRLLLVVGVLGGFTTFSAFTLDVVTLWERGEIYAAGGYALVSVAGAVLALLAGMALGRLFA